MALVCPLCGKITADPRTCEHCRADLTGLPQPPASCPLPTGSVALSKEDRLWLRDPEAYVHLPGDDASDEPWWRVRWLDGSTDHDSRHALADRERLRIPGVALIRTVVVSDGIWIFAP